MKQTLYFGISALGLLLAACGGEHAVLAEQSPSGQNAASAVKAAQYTCPMHPHYISTDSDGSCPICDMDLVPAAGNANAGTKEILYYKHPMGLPDTSPVPKKDSMGMDYVPVYAEANATGIVVSPEMIQTMGVRIASASTASFGQTIRAFGTVESDERLEAVSVSRLEGWIENLTVRAEGDMVRPGALLYRIYSPALIAAQKDYVASLTIGNENRVAAVRQRLRSIGMQNTAINHLTETREVLERVPVYAEAGGTVDKLEVREGDYVKPGTPILRLQSYSDVWVIASIPEQDLAFIDTGMPVLLDFPSAPSAPAKGRVDYIYPTINPQTRTADVRIEIDNAKGYLRPGAYADIRFELGGEPRLAVPTEAILRDSRGSHVIAALGDGRFAGRAVRTGVSANGLTEILSGLIPGDEVVASGQFMLDSEVNLREGFSKLQAPPAFAAGPDTPLSRLPVDASTLAEIDHFTDMALYFHEALTDGYKIDPYFVDPALGLGEVLRTRFADTKLVSVLEQAETALRAAKDASEGAALANELSNLMKAIEPWLLEGAPVHYRNARLTLYRDADSGKQWLQESGPARNPYGDGSSETIEWPDPMVSMDAAESERPAIDPHSGHR